MNGGGVNGARVLIGVVGLLALWGGPARAIEPAGTPKPSRDAPGDKPGRGSPFGTEGGRALESRSRAEVEAATRRLVAERIDIRGNERTSESLIRQTLLFRRGDVLTPDAIRVSRVRLFQIGAFSRVDIETLPGAAPDEVVVLVAVSEGAPLVISDLMVGQTAVSPLYGAIAVSVPDAVGDGIGLSAATALDGHGRHGARLVLYEPTLRIGTRTWVGGVQLLWDEGLESGCSTPRCGGQFSAIPWVRYHRIGGEVDVGIRPGVFTRLVAGYRFESLFAASDPGVDSSTRPSINEGHSRLSALVLGFDSDSRDDTFLPSEGTRFEARVTISSAAFGSNYEYSRFFAQWDRWFPQGGGRALRVDAAFGLVQGNAPFFDRFYAADWSYFSVGLAEARALGLNFSPDSRYDAVLGVLGGEYDFSLWNAPGSLLSHGVLAIGIRGVYTAARPDYGLSLVSATPVTADVAFRMKTSIGVIEIGLGYIIDQVLKAVPVSFGALNHPFIVPR